MDAVEEALIYGGREVSPVRLDGNRRAWNAADRHVLAHLEEQPPGPNPILLIDDECGALTIALHEHRPHHLSDSVLSQRTTRASIEKSSLSPDEFQFWSSAVACAATGSEPSWSSQRFGMVLLRIPKSVALLRYYLNAIKPVIESSTIVIASGMTRHLSPRLRDIFAADLGSVRVSPVRQKSVLFHIQPENLQVDPGALAPERYVVPADVAPQSHGASPIEVWSYPGVFSQQRLDAGTRLLLANLPAVRPGFTVVDLGCGAGVLGAVMARRSSESRLVLVDDSFLAIRSAEETFRQAGLSAEIQAEDGLSGFEPKSIDVIVTNPPIHRGGIYEVDKAVRLLRQSAPMLRESSAVRLVAVHGADLQPHLRALFPRVTRVASDKRFTVWSAGT